MAPALFSRAFIRRDHNQRGISTGRAGDHIPKEFLMAGGIDDHVVPNCRPKLNLRRIDRDILLLLLRQGIEEERIFETPTLSGAARPKRLDLSLRQRTSLLQDPPDYSRLPVIDVTNKNDLHMNPFARSFCMACGS